ncbi:MAG: sulfatase-like hydrolase/transferase [Planctomycetota bacterium]
MPRLALSAAPWAALFVCLSLAPAQENLLVLVADDLGVDYVSAYGEGTDVPPTPNLDALAARGVLFRNAWANPICSPTRACIMTGRYSLRTSVGYAVGCCRNAGELLPAEFTLPELFDAGGSGYAHGAFGKWHLGQTEAVGGPSAPNVAGWSHYAGFLGGETRYSRWQRTVNGRTTTSTAYITTQIVDDALAWIQAQTSPWLAYVAFTAPHDPKHEPPGHLHTQSFAGAGPPPYNPIPYHRAMVEAMDTEIGRLLLGLGTAINNTNVVFIGDNGSEPKVTVPPFIPSHGKWSPYEGGCNVPLIVAGPAVAGGAREETALVSAVDLFATLGELAGIDVAATVPPWIALDSISFASHLQQAGAPPVRDMVFAEQFDGDHFGAVGTNMFAAVRDDRYKVVRYYSAAGSTDEFYDLQSDPFEQTDLLLQTLTAAEQIRFDALSTELTTTRRPEARLATFGSTLCVGSNGTPILSADGSAKIGQAFTVQLSNGPPSQPCSLLIGTSYQRHGALSLPLALTTLGGGPGCFLFHSIDEATPAMTDTSGGATAAIAVPAMPALVERSVFYSWLVADPLAPSNPLGLTTTNAMAAVPGL